MTSTKKTLDFLVSEQLKKKESNNNTNDNKNNKKKKERALNPPPTIPPSPKTKHDETSATDLLLRKFELEASNETWLQNTCNKPEFNNTVTIKEQINKFNLNNHKYEYQSFIKHTKTKSMELMDEGTSLHIVKQFTDIGCPTIHNPNTKKGCWCIEEIKKHKKQQLIKQQLKQSAVITAIKQPQHKPINIMQYIRNFKNFNVQNNNANTTVDVMQKNLILNARTQHYMPSNRMQQIRMQQMLLTARTNNNGIAAINTLDANVNTTKQSILGVRTHKDTIVYSTDSKAKLKGNDANQPPTKRRKKTRWS